MTFDEYQNKSKDTAIYPTIGQRVVYPTLGLAGETGEVVEMIKKVLRGDGAKITGEKRDEFVKELGDVLWYLTQIATEFDILLSEVAETNITKLQDRKARGVLHASGNNR